jgi:hypothetical protein
LPLDPESEEIIRLFCQRVLARSSKRSAGQYRWIMRDAVRIASRVAGRRVSIYELFSDQRLLGAVFSCPTTSRTEREVSMWLTSHRRTVPTRFARLMEDELRERGVFDALERVIAALREVAKPVGTGYRLPVGRPRGRGGAMPTPEEATLVLQELAAAPGWAGYRNTAIAAILRRRGQRINALLELDGANVYRLPDGGIRIIVRAKSARQPAEVHLPNDVATAMSAYVDDFNAWARKRGLPQRIGFGLAGKFWRHDTSNRLTYEVWTRILKQAAVRRGVVPFPSHAFRRAFATEATQKLPRSVAALAGGWTSNRRMDDHYVQPSLTKLRRLLTNLGSIEPAQPTSAEPTSATVIADDYAASPV